MGLFMHSPNLLFCTSLSNCSPKINPDEFMQTLYLRYVAISRMLSLFLEQPPAVGVRHEGQPTGKFEELGGIRTYISTPSIDYPKDKVLLYLTDIFGPDLVNHQVCCDLFPVLKGTNLDGLINSFWPMALLSTVSRLSSLTSLTATHAL